MEGRGNGQTGGSRDGGVKIEREEGMVEGQTKAGRKAR